MPDASFAAAPRHNLYQNYRFQLRYKGRCVLGAASCTGLLKSVHGFSLPSTEAKTAPKTSHHRITLERAASGDLEFQTWAESFFANSPDKQASRVPSPAELFLEIVDERGNVAQCYRLHGCQIIEFKSLPDMNPKSNTVAIERVTLAVERYQLEL
ncbi:MAG TPA: phage tail protein [Opitutaceae bacterium]|nr:phage tail protein [Opitutaceae bacterium]